MTFSGVAGTAPRIDCDGMIGVGAGGGSPGLGASSEPRVSAAGAGVVCAATCAVISETTVKAATSGDNNRMGRVPNRDEQSSVRGPRM
jgi:hypothetical protein